MNLPRVEKNMRCAYKEHLLLCIAEETAGPQGPPQLRSRDAGRP